MKICLAFGIAAALGASLVGILPVKEAELRKAVRVSATAGLIRAEALAHIGFIRCAEGFLLCRGF